MAARPTEIFRRNLKIPFSGCFLWVLPLAFILLGCDRMHFSGDTRRVVESHLAQAKRLYEERDYAGAIAKYEEILRVQPDHAMAHLKIAWIYDHNLNDFLNAAYHYQRFLQFSKGESGDVDLAKSSLENVKLQFAATIPNSSGQGGAELVRLKSENEALRRQLEELKREWIRTHPKGSEPPSVATEKITPPPTNAVRNTVEAPQPKTSARPKTYTVKRGEGIQAIAQKIYGTRSKWRDIMAANPNLKDPNDLKPDQVLVLP